MKISYIILVILYEFMQIRHKVYFIIVSKAVLRGIDLSYFVEDFKIFRIFYSF